jgi:hypothetical protein
MPHSRLTEDNLALCAPYRSAARHVVTFAYSALPLSCIFFSTDCANQFAVDYAIHVYNGKIDLVIWLGCTTPATKICKSMFHIHLLFLM